MWNRRRRSRAEQPPGRAQSYERIPNARDLEFNSDKSRPMDVAPEQDGVLATATIGIVILGTRRARTLFR